MKREQAIIEKYKGLLTDEDIKHAQSIAKFVTGMSYDGRIPEGAYEDYLERKLEGMLEK